MKKLLPFLLIFFSSLFLTETAYAEVSVTQTPSPVYANSERLTLTFKNTSQPFIQGEDFTFLLWGPGKDTRNLIEAVVNEVVRANANGEITVTITGIRPNVYKGTIGTWTYRLWEGSGGDLLSGSLNLVYEGTYELYPSCSSGNGIGCPAMELYRNVFQANEVVPLTILNVDPNETYTVWFDGDTSALFSQKFPNITSGGYVQKEINMGVAKPSKTLCLIPQGINAGSVVSLPCHIKLTGIRVVDGPLPSIQPTVIQSNPTGIPSGPAVSKPPTGIPIPTAPPPPCAKGLDAEDRETTDRQQIVKCTEIVTAIGPIGVRPEDLIRRFFGILLSLAGGIALVLIIYSGYKILASQGNPEEIQGARETITSAIVGLLFIIFSLVILEIIGVDILNLPGFS